MLIIIEGQFQIFQRFSSSKLVLKTAQSRFAALNYYENGSNFCDLQRNWRSFPFSTVFHDYGGTKKRLKTVEFLQIILQVAVFDQLIHVHLVRGLVDI
jgi:hypothetical protein